MRPSSRLFLRPRCAPRSAFLTRVNTALSNALSHRFVAAWAMIVALVTSGALYAEPLGLVQRLNESDGLKIGGIESLIVTERHVFSFATSREEGGFSVFDRDPESGMLTPAYYFGLDDPANPPAVRYISILQAFQLTDELLVVRGAYLPDGCNDNSCTESRTDTYRISEDEPLILVRSTNQLESVAGWAISPDGQHLYELDQPAQIRVFDINRSGELALLEEMDTWRVAGPSLYAEQLVFLSDTLAVVEGKEDRTDATGGRLTSLARDPITGRLTPLADFDIPRSAGNVYSMIGVPGTSRLLLSVFNPDTFNRSGVLTVSVDADGNFTAGYVDSSPDAIIPNSLKSPDGMGISNDGELLLVSNSTPTEDPGLNRKALHLYTLADGGTLYWRAAELEDQDGVLPGDLQQLGTPVFSPDHAFVYVGTTERDESRLLVFAAHADLQVRAEAVQSGDDVLTDTARLTVFNAGDAAAHGIELNLSTDQPIVGIEADPACTVDEQRSAICRFDNLLPMASLELIVETARSSSESTLQANVSAIQTDLDMTNNAVIFTAGSTGSTAGPVIDTGAVLTESSGGGGCSIQASDDNRTLWLLLVIVAFISLHYRARNRS